MTRLPKTPEQTITDQKKENLARYLSDLSESRQVMFLRSLKNDTLRYDVETRLDRIKRSRKKGKNNVFTRTEL